MIQISQNITVISAVIVLRDRAIQLRLVVNAGPILLVKAPVLPHQEYTQTQGKKGGEEHECSTNRHALHKPRAFFIREDIGAQERTALADEIEQDNTSTTAGIGALVVCTT
jgi:hypothetical protein